jgi:alpha-galactosidase
MRTITVRVIRSSHANFDSLPLRFGMHFDANQTLELEIIKDLGGDPGYPDRFHVPNFEIQEMKTQKSIKDISSWLITHKT